MSNVHQCRPLRMIAAIVCSVCVFLQLPLSTAIGAQRYSNPEPYEQLWAAPAPSNVPVVFVPGTGGSELRLSHHSSSANDRLYWIGLSTLRRNGIGMAPLNEEGRDLPGKLVTAPNPLMGVMLPVFRTQEPIYSNFIAWARVVFGNRFYVAPYDWRKGAGPESAESIEQVVNKALNETQQNKVIIISHSLGGLVSRDYIWRKGRNKVAAMVAIGTPWLGLPKSVRALLWGYSFGAGKVVEVKHSIPVDALPPDYSPNCPNSRCEYFESVSLFQPEVLRKLAKNFPAIYQQLPTHDFMSLYGHVYKEPFRPVIWGKTPKQLEELFSRANPLLFSQTQRWRAEILKDDDMGVHNHLIGGVYSPDCKRGTRTERENRGCRIDNRTDMQMPEPSQVSEASYSAFTSKLINFVGLLMSVGKYHVYRDPFVAIDSDYQWGDGTTPLLSATAGEYIKGVSERVNAGNAKKFLGPSTKVYPVTLGPEHGHSLMLNDPQVRKLIVDIYREENAKLVSEPFLPPESEAVSSLLLKISAHPNGTPNSIEIRLARGNFVGKDLVRQAWMTANRLSLNLDDLDVDDSELLLPKDGSATKTILAKRQLLTSDLPHLSLSLRNITPRDSGTNLVITSVQLFINKESTPRIDYRETFTLDHLGAPHIIPWQSP